MATSYGTILKAAGLRVNAIVGVTSTLLENTYSGAISSASFDSADFPFTAFKDSCLAVESKLASAAAKNLKHPWRRSILTQTADVANKGLIPSVDASGNKVIGLLGDVFDSSTGEICEEMPLDDIRRAVRNANSWVITPIHGFAIVGDRIEHTRTNVKIDVPTYNRTTQATSIGTLTNNMLLPDDAEEAMVCGIVSLMVRDDAFMAQAQVYRAYFADALNGTLPMKEAA